MNKTELRIGNWVNVQDLELTVGMINLDISEGCEPIPLTEEWLVKFGFVKQKYEMSGCSVFEKGGWRIAYKYRDDFNEFHLWHTQVSPPTWSLCEIKYVHQLQNLYFALTGEELNKQD
tara:strand:- start:240 stop:593 length:354 start_codon:yes stop_codon:yes gene_type:complete